MANLLLITENVLLAQAISTTLTLANNEVLITHSAKDALEKAQILTPDAIICATVSDSPTLALMRRLRTEGDCGRVPFIALTQDVNEMRELMAEGADDCLPTSATAHTVATAVKARLERFHAVNAELQQRLEELNLLRQIDEELSYRLSPDWVISVMMDWSLRRTNASVAFLLMHDRENSLRVRYIAGTWDGDKIVAGDAWREDDFVNKVIQQRHSLLVDSADQDKLVKVIDKSSLSVMGVPIVASDNVLGVLLMESRKRSAFTRDDALFFDQMANRAAVAMEYSNIFERLIQQMQVEIELRDMFGRFISQEVAEAIQSGGINLQGETRTAAVLFCDIRDFTAYCDTHDPKDVVKLLNDYLPIVVKAAQQQSGIVNKFGGDSALVIYGAPNEVPNSTYKAIQTAIAIRRDIAKVSAKRKLAGETEIRIGIGITSGEVIAGAVGPAERQEYTVIGDPVNMASRLQGLTKVYSGYNVFLNQSAYDSLTDAQRDEFKLVALGGVAIQGKAELVGIWTIPPE